MFMHTFNTLYGAWTSLQAKERCSHAFYLWAVATHYSQHLPLQFLL